MNRDIAELAERYFQVIMDASPFEATVSGVHGWDAEVPDLSEAAEAETDGRLADLREAGCDLLTVTQYLRPSPRHHPVERWVKPEEFEEWSARATELGFAGVMSGPLVRSSYRAGRLYRQAVAARQSTVTTR